MKNKYIIASGYWDDGSSPPKEGWFQGDTFDLWHDNTLKYSHPSKIYVIDSCSPCQPIDKRGVEWFSLVRNFGHARGSDTKLCGWSRSYIAGAFLALMNDCDYIYKEQDCLAFGPWVEAMYNQAKKRGAQMLFGKWDHKYVVEQSLTLIKKEFIQEFIDLYTGIDKWDGRLRPEQKFHYLFNTSEKIEWLKFGYGRHRPVNVDDKVFYAQHINKGLMEKLKQKGLINGKSNPTENLISRGLASLEGSPIDVQDGKKGI